MTTRQKLEEAALVLENEGAFYRQLCDLYRNSDALPGTARIMINNHAIKAGFKGLTEPDTESLRRYFEDRWSLQTYLYSSLGPSHNLLKPEPKPPENVAGPYKHWLTSLLDIPTFKEEFLDRPKPRNARDYLRGRLWLVPNGETNASQRETLRLWLCNHFGIEPRKETTVEPAFDWQSILLDPPAAQPAQPEPQQPQIQPKPQENTTMTTTPHIIVTTQVNINGVNADTYSNAALFAMIQTQEAEVKNLLSITHKPQALLNEIEKRQAGISALVAFMDEREAKRNPQPAKPAKPTGPDLQTLQGSV